MNKSRIESKRHFRVIIGNEEYGLYISSTPSSAARKAVTKLCASNKNKKVEFYIREITQGSKKKTYGAYIGYLEKLKNPIKLKEYTIKYKPIIKLKDKLISKKLVMKGGAPRASISSQNNNVPPNNHHSEPNCCQNGTWNSCGHPPMDRTASSIWDMIRFIDAYNSTSNNNRWKFSLQSTIENALLDITNFSGCESLQYPDPEQCFTLCNSLSEIKDDEELEKLLEMINKKFTALFKSYFHINKKEDGTREIQYVM